MWTDYFKLIGIRPGRVVTHRHGTLDFSRSDLCIDTLKSLYDQGFSYLKLSKKGKDKFALKKEQVVEPVPDQDSDKD